MICFKKKEEKKNSNALVPAGRLAPGNQSGRGKDGGAQSLLGKAVQGRLESCVEDKNQEEHTCDLH